MLVRRTIKRIIQCRTVALFKALSDQSKKIPGDIQSKKEGVVIAPGDVPLSRWQYKNYIEECKYGDAQCIRLKDNVKLYLVTPAVDSFKLKNLYQLMNKVRPDLIMMQTSPYPNIKESLIQTNPQTLINPPEDILPSQELYTTIKNHLLTKGMLIDTQQLPSTYIKLHSKRLNDVLHALVSMWSVRNNVKIGLIDLPEKIYKQLVINSLSLKELQNMFSVIGIEHGIDEKLPLYETAVKCFPDVFLFFSDKYMAAVISRLSEINSAKMKKFLLFCGCGQTKSLKHYIEREDYKYTIEKCLEVPKRFETLIRRETVDMLVEKIAILEVLTNTNLNKGITLPNIQPTSLRWIREEVTAELGKDKVDIRMRLLMDLIDKYMKEKVEKEKIGYNKKIVELKSKMLNAPPVV